MYIVYCIIMSFNGYILCPRQSNMLWRTSWLALFNCMYAIKNKHYEIALVPGGVFITSIMYWRKPDYSWRRYIDISYASLSLCYQSLREYNAEYSNVYYTLASISIINYCMGVYSYKKKKYWISTYYHAGLHIFIATANFALYSGYINPIYSTPLLSYFYK